MKKLSRLRIAGLGLLLAGLSGCFFGMSGTISSTAAKGSTVSATSSDWVFCIFRSPTISRHRPTDS